jgi:hypothetical protein
MSHKTLFALTLVAALSLLAEQGIAQDSSSLHEGAWPIQNGFNRQPTQRELRALHDQDVTSGEAREVDRLYNELMSTYQSNHHTGIGRMR